MWSDGVETGVVRMDRVGPEGAGDHGGDGWGGGCEEGEERAERGRGGGWGWAKTKKKARDSGKGDKKNRRWVVKGPHLPFYPSFPR
jgi:hypothetical protein